MINAARSLFENFEEVEKLEVMRRASEILLTWIDNNRTLDFSLLGRPERRLIRALGAEHASSIRASVRREGEWPHFDYAYYLRRGVRFAAQRVFWTSRGAECTCRRPFTGREPFGGIRNAGGSRLRHQRRNR